MHFKLSPIYMKYQLFNILQGPLGCETIISRHDKLNHTIYVCTLGNIHSSGKIAYFQGNCHAYRIIFPVTDRSLVNGKLKLNIK